MSEGATLGEVGPWSFSEEDCAVCVRLVYLCAYIHSYSSAYMWMDVFCQYVCVRALTWSLLRSASRDGLVNMQQHMGFHCRLEHHLPLSIITPAKVDVHHDPARAAATKSTLPARVGLGSNNRGQDESYWSGFLTDALIIILLLLLHVQRKQDTGSISVWSVLKCDSGIHIKGRRPSP